MSHQAIPLEQLQVREPCTKPWDAMQGTDRSRFCTHCQKHVHRLGAMTRNEAEQLVCASAGRLCVLMEFAPSGELVTLDYAPPPTPRKWQRLIPVAWLAAAFPMLAGLLSLNPKPVPTIRMVAGEISMPLPVVAPTTAPAVTQCRQ